jgi:hypothetical protein
MMMLINKHRQMMDGMKFPRPQRQVEEIKELRLIKNHLLKWNSSQLKNSGEVIKMKAQMLKSQKRKLKKPRKIQYKIKMYKIT